ncbi:Pentatricopeptide repeat-containing protein [Camellia lanceoleosa]|uniref:Pentatricopeptide repeat-containing protein n=1 Tax=Camellia lanceoleosa TaxID=1840588 RepID=A0ACC0HCS6_9ERIC|nr:Pentatricopeptide repeat-containing protein [Camellia lanceoleosa]
MDVIDCRIWEAWHKVITLHKKMEYEGLKPNYITFLTLLFACSHADLTNEASECFNNMVGKYNILPRAEHYSCMVDLFARGGQFKEAYILIHEMNIKPNASLWGAILGACSICGDMSLGEVAARHLFNIKPEKSVN